MGHLIDIFVQPSKVFGELKSKPVFALPLLLLSLLPAVMLFIYFMKVDPSWYLNQALDTAGSEMSSSELAQARKIMPSTHAMAYITAITGAAGVILMSIVFALYFSLVGKMMGTNVSFKHGMALISWAGMPSLLGALVALIGVLTMSPQVPIESLMLTNVDPLLVHLPQESPWGSLARNFSLLTFWVLILTVFGWRIWTRCSWLQAIIVAALPSALIYGGMGVYGLMK